MGSTGLQETLTVKAARDVLQIISTGTHQAGKEPGGSLVPHNVVHNSAHAGAGSTLQSCFGHIQRHGSRRCQRPTEPPKDQVLPSAQLVHLHTAGQPLTALGVGGVTRFGGRRSFNYPTSF